MKLRKRFFSLMLVIAMAISLSQSIINAADSNVVFYTESDYASKVVNSGEKLGQTFTASQSFNTIRYSRDNQMTGSYIFELRKNDVSGEILYQHTYPVTTQTGDFFAVVGNFEAGTYYFEIKSVAEGKKVGIWSCEGNLYTGGSAYFNEVSQTYDLSFDVSYKDTNTVAQENEYTPPQNITVVSFTQANFNAMLLNSSDRLGQTFTASQSFNTVTYARNDQMTGAYMFELRKNGMTGEILYQHTFPLTSVTGDIDTYVGDLVAGTYYFEIKSIAEGKTVGIWTCNDNLYTGGSAYLNGTELTCDLAFSVLSKTGKSVAEENEYVPPQPGVDSKVVSYIEADFESKIVNSGDSLGQTFIASEKFNTIGFARSDQVTGSYMFELRKDGINGKILYQHRYPGDNITGPIDAFVGDLEAGTYCFEIKSVDEGKIAGIWICPDLYPEGAAYFNGAEISNDLSFNVWFKVANKVAVGNEYDPSNAPNPNTSDLGAIQFIIMATSSVVIAFRRKIFLYDLID